MKKIGYILLIFLLSCSGNGNIKKGTKDTTTSTQLKKDTLIVPENPDSALPGYSMKVLHTIKEKNYTSLAAYFHPVKAVRFSPYAYIDTTADISLGPEAFLKYCTSQKDKKLDWGGYETEGNILMSVKEYFKTFVYDADFENAPEISLNECNGSGNSLNNLKEVYKGLPYVEYYFPGFDPAFDGMDWKALRLVYEKYKGQYYLVAIVHDEWTI